MKITHLYTGTDGKSHFEEMETGIEIEQPLGNYSKKYSASGILFREFSAGLEFPMHNAPKKQYIIYLEGEVEVETSGGEKQIFKPGEVLLADDLTGAGHITRTITNGRSMIVEA